MDTIKRGSVVRVLGDSLVVISVTSVKRDGTVVGKTYELTPKRITIAPDCVELLRSRPITVIEKPAPKKSRWITTGKGSKVTFHKQPKNR